MPHFVNRVEHRKGQVEVIPKHLEDVTEEESRPAAAYPRYSTVWYISLHLGSFGG